MISDLGTPRWAQLTYSSYDDGENAGGWQVKETSGDLSREEQDQLRSQILTQLDLVVALPSFPTPEEIESLPRRLRYSGRTAGGAGYWHTVVAGPDASGRPGNVFVHAVLDRAPRAPTPPLRPVELWASPDWLCPYGAGEVRAATLASADRPRAGRAVTVQTVLEFLLDPSEWRIGVLCALLDAVVSAMAGGPPIVLAVESADVAALWIGAVSYLMAPSCSRQLGFSTYERGSALGAVWPKGVHLAAVPRSDPAVLVAMSDVVVIDSAEAVSLGVLDAEPHVTAAGSSITVTHWSALAEVSLQDASTAERMIRELDDVADLVGDVPMGIAWPLAAAMSRSYDGFEDVSEHLSQVLISGPPVTLYQAPELAALVEDHLLQRIGDSAANAWSALPTVNDGPTRDMAVDKYVQLAVQDDAWLAQAGGAPLPNDYRASGVSAAAAFEQAVQRLVEAARSEDGDVLRLAVAALGLLDFGYRAGLVSSGSPVSTRDWIAQLLDEVLVRCLIAPQGRELGACADPHLESAILQEIRQALDVRLSQLGSPQHLPGLELDPAVTGWLFAGWSRPFSLDDLDHGTVAAADVGPGAIAHIIRTALASATDAGPQEVVPVALWFALWAQELNAEPAVADIVAELARREIDAWQLHTLLKRFGAGMPPRPVASVLAMQAWTQDVKWLAQDVLNLAEPLGQWATKSDGDRARGLARLRVAANRTGPSGHPVSDSAEMLRLVEDASLPISLEPLGSELAPLIVSAAVTMGLAAAAEALQTTQAWQSAQASTSQHSKRQTREALGDTSDLRAPDGDNSGRLVQRPPEEQVQAPADTRESQPNSYWAPHGGPTSPARPRAGPDSQPSEPSFPAPRPRRGLEQAGGDGLGPQVWQLIRASAAAMDERARRVVFTACAATDFNGDIFGYVAIMGPVDFPFSTWRRPADVTHLYGVTLRSGEPLFDVLVVELLRGSAIRFEAKDVDDLVDRIGQAQFGMFRWTQMIDERDKLARWARRRWKELSSSDASVGERTRGLLRRGQ